MDHLIVPVADVMLCRVSSGESEIVLFYERKRQILIRASSRNTAEKFYFLTRTFGKAILLDFAEKGRMNITASHTASHKAHGSYFFGLQATLKKRLPSKSQ